MNFNKKLIPLYKKPTAIYKIDNFFDKDFYLELKNNFPTIKNNRINSFVGRDEQHGKQAFYDYELKSVNAAQKKTFSKLDGIIRSQNFFNFFIKNFYFEIVKNQNSFLRKLRYLRYPIIDKKNDSFFDFLFSKIKITYDFSFIKNNGKIVPHTDGQRKYLSLMLYFPDDNEKEKDYGTTFWESNKPNYLNTHIHDPNQEDKFKLENKVLYKTL